MKRNREKESVRILEYLPVHIIIFFCRVLVYMENLTSFESKSYRTQSVVKRNRDNESAIILEYLSVLTIIFFCRGLLCMENLTSFERKS